MPTPNERKALGFLVALALSGAGVRLWRAAEASDGPPVRVEALDAQLARVDAARRSGRPGREPSNGAPGDARRPAPAPVDLDRASARDMEALPGIGPALARRIVAHRDSVGPFGSLDALCAVRGIGPATAERLRPLVTFSAPPRPLSGTCGGGSRGSRKSRVARPAESR